MYTHTQTARNSIWADERIYEKKKKSAANQQSWNVKSSLAKVGGVQSRGDLTSMSTIRSYNRVIPLNRDERSLASLTAEARV